MARSRRRAGRRAIPSTCTRCSSKSTLTPTPRPRPLPSLTPSSMTSLITSTTKLPACIIKASAPPSLPERSIPSFSSSCPKSWPSTPSPRTSWLSPGLCLQNIGTGNDAIFSPGSRERREQIHMSQSSTLTQ
ncbi:unnamed protein product [Staurois parvus]|uniref:Uncharacterized protein n=1 Tax=Staurois parvus TaxID=386267 RepID=A0ABN9BBQ3_9NEOB|nr:unnamed protein product [Staurois parvus]